MTRPSVNPMLPAPARVPSQALPTRSDGARLLVLGVNLWLVAAAIPALIASRWTVLAASSLALVPLVGGVAALRRPGAAGWLANTALLGLVPLGVLGAVLFLERGATGDSHPPLARALASASLLAYLAVTAAVLARPAERSDVRHRDMKALTEDPDGVGRRWRRRGVLTIAGLGALALALVAPFHGGGAALYRAWGDAADAAGALAAAAGGALGVLVLAAFVGPGLRRQRPPTVGRRRWRVAMYTLVALCGTVVHTLLQRG